MWRLLGCRHVLFATSFLLEFLLNAHTEKFSCMTFNDLKSFGNLLAKLKSRLRENAGLIKEKMRMNLYTFFLVFIYLAVPGLRFSM